MRVRRKARFIDENQCTGCGKCAEVCPVDVINTFDEDLSTRKATYRNSAQSVPGAYVIEKGASHPAGQPAPPTSAPRGILP